MHFRGTVPTSRVPAAPKSLQNIEQLHSSICSSGTTSITITWELVRKKISGLTADLLTQESAFKCDCQVIPTHSDVPEEQHSTSPPPTTMQESCLAYSLLYYPGHKTVDPQVSGERKDGWLAECPANWQAKAIQLAGVGFVWPPTFEKLDSFTALKNQESSHKNSDFCFFLIKTRRSRCSMSTYFPSL